eukprot:CAMPEP_0117423248 /NCGR_PEP_ID=MMETSP0758-20121206/3918_1 /TAXON_ID=63605 /ORGANISM="Percolomonas cosmopolitus, Strain AE-1 (ATCC 50343)" /LENGTH=895 /DNA_ID=CAMNT_0005206339 /DNA_START=646 /DNA_END=3334 /DNA_ORIENTATION=-
MGTIGESDEGMVDTLQKCLSHGNFVEANNILMRFTEIATNKPTFFSKTIQPVARVMLEIANGAHINETCAMSANEWICTLTENAGSIVNQEPEIIKQFVPSCINWVLGVEMTEEWATLENDDNASLTLYEVGVESLDRISLALGPVVGEYMLGVINNLWQGQDWKHRFAAITTISQTCEGCGPVFERQMESLANKIFTGIDDEHPMVRHASIRSIAQLCEDFNPEFQYSYKDVIFKILLKEMGDPVPKNQAYAAACLTNVCNDEIEEWPEYLRPYIDNFISKIVGLLQNGLLFVKEKAISALTTFAEIFDTEFNRFYDQLFPILVDVIEKATSKQEEKLRSLTISCLVLASVAIGQKLFMPKSERVIGLLYKVQEQIANVPDNTLQVCLLKAWTRIARIMGDAFVPHFDNVMPPLLRSASITPTVIMTDFDEQSQFNINEYHTVSSSFEGIGIKRFSIKTSELQELHSAIGGILSYVSFFQEKLYKYHQDMCNIIIPSITKSSSHDIRELACETLAQLILMLHQAIKKNIAPADKMFELMDFALHTLDTSIHECVSLNDRGGIRTLFLCLHDCLDVISEDVIKFVQPKYYGLFAESIYSNIMEAILKRNELTKDIEMQEDICEVIERLEDERIQENEIVEACTDVSGTFLEHCSSGFTPIFHEKLWKKLFLPMLDENAPQFDDEDRVAALCISCDFVSYGGGAAGPYMNKITNFVMGNMNSTNHKMLYSVAYAQGVLSQFFPRETQQHVPRMLNHLRQLIHSPQAQMSINLGITCNAIASFYKILKFANPSENQHDMLNEWMSYLPARGDEIEARKLHSELVNYVKNNHPVVMSNLPKVFHIFSVVMNSKNATKKDSETMHQLAQELLQRNPQQANQALSMLDEFHRKKLLKQKN